MILFSLYNNHRLITLITLAKPFLENEPFLTKWSTSSWQVEYLGLVVEVAFIFLFPFSSWKCVTSSWQSMALFWLMNLSMAVFPGAVLFTAAMWCMRLHVKADLLPWASRTQAQNRLVCLHLSAWSLAARSSPAQSEDASCLLLSWLCVGVVIYFSTLTLGFSFQCSLITLPSIFQAK